MKTLVIIQARMGGTRLPGKVREEIAGMSVLEHVVRRCRHRGYTTVIAAARDGDWAWSNRWRVAVPDNRGAPAFVPLFFTEREPGDLLGRYADTVEWANQMSRFLNAGAAFDAIVRVTADCPFLPTAAIDAVAEAVTSGRNDYCETRSDPSTRPNGIDAQGFSRRLLVEADRLATKPEDREHVTGALLAHASAPGRVQVLEGIWLDDLPYFRVTLDTPQDLETLRAVAEHVPVDPTAGRPTLTEIRDLHRQRPELFE